MRRRWSLVLALLPAAPSADPWTFAPPLEVTPVQGAGIFHHLESSGRRSVAVAGDRVAVVWEDERDGKPRAYVASKPFPAAAFEAPAAAVSGEGEAFEPTIVGLADGRFALGWEEDTGVRVRLLSFAESGRAELGPVLALSIGDAGQVGLAGAGDRLLAVWSERHAEARHIRFAALGLRPASAALEVATSCAVEADAPVADQLYPTLVALPAGAVVAWEDRRHGHTVIMASRATPGTACAFTVPQRVSEAPPGPKAPYGKGHGVSRVALAHHGADRLLAAWADKRDFRHGYDIYGSAATPGGRFGPNFRIQDDFGELSQQWHTALAGHRNGAVVVAWDDNREGDPDIYLSWPQGDGWSDDLAVPGASGPGVQQHPAIAFDPAGRLHLAWVERAEAGGPTRLRYAVAAPDVD